MAVETTATFRSLIETRAAQYPPPGPPSGSRQPGSSIHKRKPSVDVHPVGGWVDGRQAAAATEPARPKRAEDAFLKEAYQIHHHLGTFRSQLAAIRRQYLAIAPSSTDKGKAREQPRFDDKDREEFDLRAKLLLKGCLERILVLEREEERTSRGKKKAGLEPESTANRLLQLLVPPSMQPLLPSSPSSLAATLIAAHHASVLYHLQSTLSRAGAALSDLQEERMRRLEEADRSLGNRAAFLSAGSASQTASGEPAGFIVPAAPVIEREGEEALSQEMMQLFEEENAELMQGFNSHLDQIRSTQEALAQISTLQSLLSQSLMQQSEVSDRLLLEAGQGVADVKAGNEQLRKANERASSSTLMILVFLVGASLALLFVDWYS